MKVEYKSIVFDCDGVVLNSNKIKTEAFYQASKHFGHEPAQNLVDYHIKNGGVSRYAKFEYFLSKILCQDIEQATLDNLLTRFAQAVKKDLMSCEIAEGLDALRDKTEYAKWFIVSGGDQSELRDVFAERGLTQYFNGGIFGSPDTKSAILEREILTKNITMPGLFLGDSKYDYLAAKQAGLDFVFISRWSEVKDWQTFVATEKLKQVSGVKDLTLCF